MTAHDIASSAFHVDYRHARELTVNGRPAMARARGVASMHPLSIGQLARAARVSTHTIRYYEKAGLLPPPARRPSGYREYTERELLQLKFVRQARALGFGLDEVSELLSLDSPQLSLDESNKVIERKLAAIDRRLAALTRWREALSARERNQAADGATILCLAEDGDDADTDASGGTDVQR